MKRLPLVTLLVPFVWLAPVYLGGRALFWGTPALQFFPWWHLAAQMLLHGHLPLWNPLAGMGAPLFANYQSALLYPPVWLLLLLDALGGLPALAWGATLVLAAHLTWGAWGMTRLGQALGLRPLAQTISGLAFGMCGYLSARAALFPGMIFAAAWLPWVLLGVQRLAREEHRRWLSPAVRLLAFSAGLQLLSGHAQTTWYTFLLAGVWYAVQRAQSGWQSLRSEALRLGRAASAFALGALLAAPQLLATAEYLGTSQRASAYAYEAAMTYSFWPWRILGLLTPDLFGSPAHGNFWGYAAFWEDAIYLGMLPAGLLIGWAITRLVRRRRARTEITHRALPGIAAAALLLALGQNTPLFPWLYRHVPTFDMFQAPTRWNIWLEFALALLAGLAAERWQRPGGRALYWTRLGTAGAFAVTLGAGLGRLVLPGSLERLDTMVRAFAWMGFWALGCGLLTLTHPRAAPKRNPAWENLFPWLAAGWLALDLLHAAWGLAPAVGLDFYRQPSAQAAQVRAMLSPDGGRLYLPAADEYDLKFHHFLRFDTFSPAVPWRALPETLLPNLFLPEEIPSVNNFDPLLPGNYARWMDVLAGSSPAQREWMLNRMAVSVVERAEPEPVGQVRFGARDGARRWRWEHCGRVLSGQALWDAVAQAPPDEVLLSGGQPPAEGLCFPAGAASIQRIAENPQALRFHVQAESPGWFILADVWYPQWQAFVDGVRVPVWQADVLFRGVYLPAGSHKVDFVYRPWWRWSILFSLAAAALLATGRHQHS